MEYYQRLELNPRASAEEIKQAFRRLARQYHPDLAGAEYKQQFQDINEAYQVLSDPQRRRAYDQKRLPARPPESNSSHVVFRSSSLDDAPSRAEKQAFAQAVRQIKERFVQKSYQEAVRAAEDLVRSYPRNAEATHVLALSYQWYGNVLLQQGDPPQAKVYLLRALDTEPHNRELAFEIQRDLSRINR